VLLCAANGIYLFLFAHPPHGVWVRALVFFPASHRCSLASSFVFGACVARGLLLRAALTLFAEEAAASDGLFALFACVRCLGAAAAVVFWSSVLLWVPGCVHNRHAANRRRARTTMVD
jgi:hypothetical protein